MEDFEKKGKLFVIEGSDASGKETQSKQLSKRLRRDGITSQIFDFPRYETPTGNILKRYLGKGPYQQEFGPAHELNPRVASVFFALDRHAAKKEMERYLEDGFQVIANRYVESNMAHQGGKIGDPKERAALISWIDELEYGNFALPRPDKVIFLYVPLEVALDLRKGRKEQADGHESNLEHLKNAEQTYLELASTYHWTTIDCAPDKTIHSLRTIDDIADEVYNHVLEELAR